MALPVPVQASAGLAVTTGTGTLSLTGCTAGNLVVFHVGADGNGDDYSFSNVVNVEKLDGTNNDFDNLVSQGWVGAGPSAKFTIFVGRAMADGTCSCDITVGASGNDLFGLVYEFSDASLGTTVATVFENGAQIQVSGANDDDTIGSEAVVSNGPNRLALVFGTVNDDLVIGDYVTETGGDYTEFAGFESASGTQMSLTLQAAEMPTQGTITPGHYVMTAAAAWGHLSTALIGTGGSDGYRIPTRFAGPQQLTASPVTLYTAPTSRIAILRHIDVYNPTAGSVSLTMSVGTDAAATRLYDGYAIPAGKRLNMFIRRPLVAGEKIEAFASEASKLIITLSGDEAGFPA